MSENAKKVHAFKDDALGELDAMALAARIKKKEISAKEAVTASIERAQAVNPHINAIVTELYDRAIETVGHICSGH